MEPGGFYRVRRTGAILPYRSVYGHAGVIYFNDPITTPDDVVRDALMSRHGTTVDGNYGSLQYDVRTGSAGDVMAVTDAVSSDRRSVWLEIYDSRHAVPRRLVPGLRVRGSPVVRLTGRSDFLPRLIEGNPGMKILGIKVYQVDLPLHGGN